MPQVISEQEFDSLVELVNDPEKASRLSLDQLREVEGLMTGFQKDRSAFRERLIGEGLSEEQIVRLDAKRGEFVEPDPAIKQRPPEAAGLVEGVAQAVEGVFDLAKDISVGLGIEDDASRQQWKESLNQDRMQRREQHIAEFGKLPSGASEFVGEVMPWVAALPASASGFVMTLAQRLMQGAAIGGSTVQGSEDTLVDRVGGMSLGAAIGGASSLLSVWPAFKKSAARAFTSSYNAQTSAQAERVEQLVQEMTGNPEFAFSLAQTTGNRSVLALETAAAQSQTKAAQNKNIGILVTHLLRTSKEMAGTGQSAGKIARSLRGTLKEAREQIYRGASQEWQASSEALLTQFPDDVVISGKTYLDKIDRLINESEDALAGVGGRAGPELRAYRAEVDEIVNPVFASPRTVRSAGADPRGPRSIEETVYDVVNRKDGSVLARGLPQSQARQAAVAANENLGGVTSEETLRIMKGLNKLIGGDVVIFEKGSVGSNRNVGRALMGTFTDELDNSAKNPEAAAGLKAIRDGYKEQMARAEAIDNTVVNAAFGGKKLPKEPGKRLDAILKSEKEDLVAVREFLEEWNPQLLDDLRATHLQRIAKGSATGSTPFVDLQTTITGLANRLSSNFGRAGQAGKGLHTAAVQADMLATASALRVLNNKYIKGIAPGGFKVDDLAINVISRSPEFMGRFLARALSGSHSMERLLLDPKFRTAIQRVATEPLTSRKGVAAMVTLSGIINSQVAVEKNRAIEETNRLNEIK